MAKKSTFLRSLVGLFVSCFAEKCLSLHDRQAYFRELLHGVFVFSLRDDCLLVERVPASDIGQLSCPQDLNELRPGSSPAFHHLRCVLPETNGSVLQFATSSLWDVQTQRVQVHNQMRVVRNSLQALKLHYSKRSTASF